MRLYRYSQVWMLPDRGKPAHGRSNAGCSRCMRVEFSHMYRIAGGTAEVQTQIRLRHARSAAPSVKYREHRGARASYWSTITMSQ